MNTKNQIEELVTVSKEFESNILNDFTQSIYQDLINFEEPEDLFSNLSEIMFLIDEIMDETQEYLKEEVEIIIEEIREELI